jgi:hypothetical protein
MTAAAATMIETVIVVVIETAGGKNAQEKNDRVTIDVVLVVKTKGETSRDWMTICW